MNALRSTAEPEGYPKPGSNTDTGRPCGLPDDSSNAEQEIPAVAQTPNVLQGDVEAARQRLLGQPRDVWREHNVVQRQERVVGRRGLLSQHVEAGGQQSPARKSLDQGRLLDEAAARGVD